jgi:hypothetical protein
MGDSRPMTTPMITNWKKLHASESQLVDSTLYHQLIGSLMYLVNTRPDICFAVNTLSQFMVEPRRVHWVAAKLLVFSKPQPSFSLTDFSAKVKCRNSSFSTVSAYVSALFQHILSTVSAYTQHCFSIYSALFQHILNTVSAYTQHCFSIYSALFQHILSTVSAYTQHCFSIYSTLFQHILIARCFSIYSALFQHISQHVLITVSLFQHILSTVSTYTQWCFNI